MTKLAKIGSLIINSLMMIILLVTFILYAFNVAPVWLYYVAGFYTLAVMIVDSFIQINVIRKGQVRLFGKVEK